MVAKNDRIPTFYQKNGPILSYFIPSKSISEKKFLGQNFQKFALKNFSFVKRVYWSRL